MKKVLLSLVAVVMALCATAATTTITWSAQTGNFPTKWGTENTVTAEGFTFKINKNNGSTNPTYNTNGKDLRVYANGTIEITGTDDMTEINFVISTAGLKRLTNITANVGTVSGLEDCKNKKQGEIIVKWTGNAKTVTLTVGEKSTYGTDGATKAGQLDFISTEITTADSGDTREPAGLAWSENAVTVLTTEIADFTAPTLTNPNNVAVTYASDNAEVATVTEAGAVTLTGAKGAAKITATFDGTDTYKPQEVSYTITVKAPLPVNTSSLENPYTVAEALAIIADLDGTTMDNVYVKGIVGANPTLAASFGNMDYNILDTPTSTASLLIFRGKYFNGEKFNAQNQLKEGDEVIVKGSMVNYNGNTPQMSANNVVVSLNGSTTPPVIEATEVNNVLATTALVSGTPVKVNYALTVGYASGSSIFACDEDGDFIQLYGTNILKAGDVIPAGWEGTYTLYGDNTPEITFNEGALPAATEGTFTPKEVEATAITDALVNHVVTVKNVNFEEATPATKTDFTGTVGETTLNLYNQYELASVEAGKYDVTGVVAIRNLNGSPVAKFFVTNITKSETDSALLIGAGDNAAPVEYYNLQGVRIDNPANGIFIRRQGSKAQKIVL